MSEIGDQKKPGPPTIRRTFSKYARKIFILLVVSLTVLGLVKYCQHRQWQGKLQEEYAAHIAILKKASRNIRLFQGKSVSDEEKREPRFSDSFFNVVSILEASNPGDSIVMVVDLDALRRSELGRGFLCDAVMRGRLPKTIAEFILPSFFESSGKRLALLYGGDETLMVVGEGAPEMVREFHEFTMTCPWAEKREKENFLFATNIPP